MSASYQLWAMAETDMDPTLVGSPTPGASRHQGSEQLQAVEELGGNTDKVPGGRWAVRASQEWQSLGKSVPSVGTASPEALIWEGAWCVQERGWLENGGPM